MYICMYIVCVRVYIYVVCVSVCVCVCVYVCVCVCVCVCDARRRWKKMYLKKKSSCRACYMINWIGHWVLSFFFQYFFLLVRLCYSPIRHCRRSQWGFLVFWFFPPSNIHVVAIFFPTYFHVLGKFFFKTNIGFFFRSGSYIWKHIRIYRLSVQYATLLRKAYIFFSFLLVLDYFSHLTVCIYIVEYEKYIWHIWLCVYI